MKILPRLSDTNGFGPKADQSMLKRPAIRSATALAVIAAILGAGATSAAASQTFGSDLSEAANTIGGGCGPELCTVLTPAFKPGNSFPSTSPIGGVVVRFGIKVGAADTVTFVLGQFDGVTADGTVSVVGPTADLASAGTYSVPARVPVAAGDVLGFDYRQDFTDPVSCTGGWSYVYDPMLVPGNSPQPDFGGGACERLVNAVVEPDADHDVFGDETQDKCVGTAGAFNGCPNTVSSVSAAQAGHKPKIRVTATVPGAGTLNAGSANDASVASAASAVSLKPVTQTLTSTSSREVTLTLKLTKSAKGKLARKGKLKTNVKVVYTPPGGPAGSITSKVSLKGTRG